MFREVARKKQALGKEECIDILKESKRGVLSVLSPDGYPYGSWINHYYREEDGKIYFHGGKTGHKIDAMRACDKVSFCTSDDGERKEGDWFLTFRSVIVFGRIEFIEDTDMIYAISRELSCKFTDDTEYIEDTIRRAGPATCMFALVPEHITGKTVREK